jgi:hypothetical protein
MATALSKLIGGIEVGNTWSKWSAADDGEHVVEITNVYEYESPNNGLACVIETRVVRSDVLAEGTIRHRFRDIATTEKAAKASPQMADIARFAAAVSRQLGVQKDDTFMDSLILPAAAYESGEVVSYAGTQLGVRVSTAETKNGRMFTNVQFFNI